MVKLSPQEGGTHGYSDFEQIETGFVAWCWNFFRKRSAKNGTGRYSL
jgi:hypothetical protein